MNQLFSVRGLCRIYSQKMLHQSLKDLSSMKTRHDQSIGCLYEAGQTHGFDYLRISLAIGVLCIHSFAVSYGKSGENFLYAPPWRGFVMFVLPAFFALSGFLVSGSLVRTPQIGRFLALRVLRIVPALGVEVTLCAVLLGPIFTTYSLDAYFSDREFRQYFFNIVGHIHYLLPGVFRDNPYNFAVNVSLWTVPYELECYLALTAIAIGGVLRNKILLVFAVIAAHVLVIGRDVIRGAAELPIDGALPGRILVLSFLMGIIFFIFRNAIIVRPRYVGAAIFISVFALNLPYLPYLIAPIVTYATVGLGLSKVKKGKLLSSGDYSYGVYLYAFPIQQTVSHVLPFAREWYLNIALSLPLTLLFAIFSWHAVEKHALKLKKFIRSRVRHDDGEKLKFSKRALAVAVDERSRLRPSAVTLSKDSRGA